MQKHDNGFGLLKVVAAIALALLALALFAFLASLLGYGFIINMVFGLIAAVITFVFTLKALSPETAAELMSANDKLEYDRILQEVLKIADYISSVAGTVNVPSEVSLKLRSIGRKFGQIVKRYKGNKLRFADATALQLMAEQFKTGLETYIGIRNETLFVSAQKREEEIRDTEEVQIPIMIEALTNLGARIDQGKVTSKDVSEGTLEDLAKSLGLIEDLKRNLK